MCVSGAEMTAAESLSRPGGRSSFFMIRVSGVEMTAAESLSRPGGRSSFLAAFLSLSFLSTYVTSITDTYPK